MLSDCGLEKTLESPLDSREIKPDSLKGNQPWILIGRTDAEAPILWPPEAKRQHTGKNSDAEERLRSEGDKGDRGWDGWMASHQCYGWTWANSRRWWGTGKPDVLQSLVRHDLATDHQQQFITIVEVRILLEPLLLLYNCYRYYLMLILCVCVLTLVLTLYNPMDGSPSGSSVHGIFQAGILELAAICYSRRSSQPKNQTCGFCISHFGKLIL